MMVPHLAGQLRDDCTSEPLSVAGAALIALTTRGIVLVAMFLAHKVKLD